MGEGLFRVLSRLYPPEFRRRYGSEQMEFLRQERASSVGFWGACGFWSKALWDGVGAALRLRLRSISGRGPLLDPGSGRGGSGGEGRDLSLLAELSQDVRFALRSLRKQPSFTLVAVGVLGIGIGASTTLFSAVNGVLLLPLPYPDQDQLVFLGSKFPNGTRISGMSVPEFMDVRGEIGSVRSLAGVRGRALDLIGDGEPERVAVAEVSPEYFQLLGVVPSKGQLFSREAYEGTESGVILVSHGLWKRRWGGDVDIVGRTVLASDGRTPELQTYTIVGVLPPDFESPPPLENTYSRLPPADIWAPLPLNGEMYSTPRTNYTVKAVGHLAEGASLESLNAELEALGVALTERYPEAHLRGETYLSLGAKPLLDEMVGSRQKDLLILLGATGLLLLIACANVAGLLVARGLDRIRELGLRTALGAGRYRLFRQLVTENLVLAFLGGGLGVSLAVFGVGLFRKLGPEDFPRMAEITLDLPVLLFSLGSALLTGLAFGIGPALAGSREGQGWTLLPGGRAGTSSRKTARIRSGLVAFEVALALVLLTGCGLLTRSMLRLQSVDPGLRAENLALMQIRLLPSYDEEEERRVFFSSLEEGLATLPGVLSVSHVSDPPMGFAAWGPAIWREEDISRGEDAGWANGHRVGLDYFETMGIPILRGRGFTGGDGPDAPKVMVVGKALAERLWPGEDPLGKRLDLSRFGEGPWYTVVGLAGDIRQRSLASELGWHLYIPFPQHADDQGGYMVIRTAGDPLELAPRFRQVVWALDAHVPIPEITTMEARVDATLRLPRFRTLLLASFAMVALLLSATGIYGTLMYTVGRRTPEVGIRMALGAEAKDVVGLVLRQGIVPVALGLGVGGVVSLAATRVLESVLFQTTPNDPMTFVLVSGALVGVCLLAAYLPARRASRVDPQEALRGE